MLSIKDKVLKNWEYNNGVFTNLKTGSNGTNMGGYLYIRVNRKLYSVAQLVFLMEWDVLPITSWGGQVIDHINGDTLDNRPENLRLVSHSENLRNNKRKREQKLPNDIYVYPKGVEKCIVVLRDGRRKWLAHSQDDVKKWLRLNAHLLVPGEDWMEVILKQFEPCLDLQYMFKPNDSQTFNLVVRKNSYAEWKTVVEGVPYSKFRKVEKLVNNTPSISEVKRVLGGE